MTVDVVVHRPLLRPDAQELVDALVAAFRDSAADQVVVRVADELVRNEARGAGFVGPLRSELLWSSLGSAVPVTAITREELAVLLPGRSVRVRSSFRMLRFDIIDDDAGIRVRVPRRPDVMPEAVACAVDTALKVKQRFGVAARGIKHLSIDHDSYAFRHRQASGLATSSGVAIMLNADLVCADGFGGRPRRSAMTPPPFARIDEVAAHESWHCMDSSVLSTTARYAEFNRVLGAELGVATLEHALRGGEPGAPVEWSAAHERFIREVSEYGGTNWLEASAEMFSRWWCSRGGASPLVARFGALMDEWYPPRLPA